MMERLITFRDGRGALASGRLSVPVDGDPVACVLFAHCLAESGGNAARDIVRALMQQRFAVLEVQCERAAGSAGEAVEWSIGADDLVAAAAQLDDRFAIEVLVGHAQAGAATLRASARIDGVGAVATICAPLDAVAEQPGVPLLIMDAADSTDAESVARLLSGAAGAASFIALDGADALLSRSSDARYAGAMLAGWARRHIGDGASDASIDALRETSVFARTETGAFRTEVMARGHALLADEPVAVGGEDLGFSPYDLLAAALGACTTMTVRMYAERKGWPLEEAAVRLRHSRIHAEDEKRCETEEVRLDQLDRELMLRGPLDAEQRARLLEIAGRCPVHRTLSAGVRVVTSLVEEPASPPN